MELEAVFIPLGWIALFLIAYTRYSNLKLKVVRPFLDIKPRFIFFYAPWCPWSKKARKHWEEFKDELERHPLTFGGQTVHLEEVDGDRFHDLLKQHGITAYPTFKLVTTLDTYEFNGHPDATAFRRFLINHLGQEEPVKLLPGRVQNVVDVKLG